jgi:hypothetical protein
MALLRCEVGQLFLPVKMIEPKSKRFKARGFRLVWLDETPATF